MGLQRAGDLVQRLREKASALSHCWFCKFIAEAMRVSLLVLGIVCALVLVNLSDAAPKKWKGKGKVVKERGGGKLKGPKPSPLLTEAIALLAESRALLIDADMKIFSVLSEFDRLSTNGPHDHITSAALDRPPDLPLFTKSFAMSTFHDEVLHDQSYLAEFASTICESGVKAPLYAAVTTHAQESVKALSELEVCFKALVRIVGLRDSTRWDLMLDVPSLTDDVVDLASLLIDQTDLGRRVAVATSNWCVAWSKFRAARDQSTKALFDLKASISGRTGDNHAARDARELRSRLLKSASELIVDADRLYTETQKKAERADWNISEGMHLEEVDQPTVVKLAKSIASPSLAISAPCAAPVSDVVVTSGPSLSIAAAPIAGAKPSSYGPSSTTASTVIGISAAASAATASTIDKRVLVTDDDQSSTRMGIDDGDDKEEWTSAGRRPKTKAAQSKRMPKKQVPSTDGCQDPVKEATVATVNDTPGLEDGWRKMREEQKLTSDRLAKEKVELDRIRLQLDVDREALRECRARFEVEEKDAWLKLQAGQVELEKDRQRFIADHKRARQRLIDEQNALEKERQRSLVFEPLGISMSLIVAELISRKEHQRPVITHTFDVIKQIIKDVYPDAMMITVGSVANDLHLPAPFSDIDIVVSNTQAGAAKDFFELISNACLKWSEYLGWRVDPLPDVPVPVIKLYTPDINVDIVLKSEFADCARLMFDDFKSNLPNFNSIALYMKYFLKMLHLNDTFFGGVGSFLVQLMVASHIQLQGERCNIVGQCLLSFFEFFGKIFDVERECISVRKGGLTFLKVSSPPDFLASSGQGSPFAHTIGLCVENPFEPRVNVANGAFAFENVRKVFAIAHDLLSNGKTPLHELTTVIFQRVQT